jgi:hypothetical protein
MVRRSGREHKKRLLNWVQRLMRQNGASRLQTLRLFCASRLPAGPITDALAEERTERDRRMRRDVISNCRVGELAAVSV